MVVDEIQVFAHIEIVLCPQANEKEKRKSKPYKGKVILGPPNIPHAFCSKHE